LKAFVGHRGHFVHINFVFEKTPAVLRKIKMLIVEDNEDERIFIKEGLLRTGLYEIVGEAKNGNQMLELLNEPSFPLPDVILSDLNMPGKNGYEVITEIKSHESLSHIAFAILTTAPLRPFAERCKKLGACSYFTKPDTFLEYKKFGEDIYTDLKDCLDNLNLNFSGLAKLKRILNHSLFRTSLRIFINPLKSRLYPKPG
jgi:CheY-like chemotaxis protein